MKKSEIYRKAANEFLNLTVSQDYTIQNWTKDFPDFDLVYPSLRPPYMCDAIDDAVCSAVNNTEYHFDFVEKMKDMMLDYGLPSLGTGALRDIKPIDQQEARWFFLMFMAEVCDDNE
jgi:hypothetical protein